MGTTTDCSSFIDRFLTSIESVDVKDAVQSGVKGMRWGVRKDPGAGPGPASEVGVKVTPGKKVKTTGGKERPASEDAVKAAVGKQIAKKSSTDALSNQELQAVVTRMQLEQNYARLSKEQKVAGRNFIVKMLSDKKQRTAATTAANQIHDVIVAKKVGDSISNVKL